MEYKKRDWLFQKYIVEKCSARKIGRECSCNGQTILNWLKSYKIKIRTLSGSHLGIYHTAEAKKKISETKMGHSVSEETKKKISKSRVGKYGGKNNPMYGRRKEKSFNWNGGGYDYYGPDWYEQRNKALYRDGYICQNCGLKKCDKNGNEHIVHHIFARDMYIKIMLNFYSFIPENVGRTIFKLIPSDFLIPDLIWNEMNRLENLVTLCRQPCHKDADRKQAKKYDWKFLKKKYVKVIEDTAK